MTTKTSKRKDYTQLAFAVVQQATGEVEPAPELTGKSPIAQGGERRQGQAEKLTPEERSEVAKKAADARWNNNLI